MNSSSIKIFFYNFKIQIGKFLAFILRLVKKFILICFRFLEKVSNAALKKLLKHKYYHWIILEFFFAFLLLLGIIVGIYIPFNFFSITAIILVFVIGLFISYNTIAKLFSSYRRYQGKEKHINRMNAILKTFSLYEKTSLISFGFAFGLFFVLLFYFQERFWETLTFLQFYIVS